MRTFDRSVLASLLLLGAATAVPVLACSTSDDAAPDPTTPGDEAGVTTDGATTTDGGVVTPPQKCAKSSECASGVCNLATGLCNAASCKDGTKNTNETDVDCGGGCATCDALKMCKVAADCTSSVCAGLKCQAPTPTDGVKNGNETGIDCGGTGNTPCAIGGGCAARTDCASDYCKAGVCTSTTLPNGVKDGNETDVDCGGTGNARCADTLGCAIDDDCKSDVCKNLFCAVPAYDDSKKNGNETDVDCGGDPAHACAVGKSCKVGTDCTTLGCNYKFTCAAGRSCTNPLGYGADTCGFGGEGPADIVAAKDWEDCCAKAAVVASTGPSAGQTVLLDKYEVTAGRMRVFLEDVKYDVRGFVQQARTAGKIPGAPGVAGKTVLEAAWDPYLPTSFAGNQNADELSDCDQSGAESLTSTVCKAGTQQPGIYTSIRNHLGGTIFKGNNQTQTGCFIGTAAIGGGTHAFRFPDGTAEPPSGTPAIDQNGYDEKGMNCITYLVGQAFCVWEGGRLELGQEQIAAWGGTIPASQAVPFPQGSMPWAAMSSSVPVEPNQRTSGQACVTGSSTAAVNAACGNEAKFPAYGCVGNMCVLNGGDRTYWGCRFPWATDAKHDDCGLSWPAGSTIEYADYKYTYEYPKAESVLNEDDYIIYISAPGRTRGRGPAGHADLVGNTFALTSNLSGITTDPQTTTHGWSSNGSFEVHNYSKPTNGLGVTSNLLNKYGKLGLRCAFPQ